MNPEASVRTMYGKSEDWWFNNKSYVKALELWYGADNEDRLILRRSEVGALLEEIGVKER